MSPGLFQQLTSRDALLSLGVSLGLIGLILRGFARSNKRAMALRRQHALLLRKLGEPDRAEKVDEKTRHLEKYLPRYANGLVAAGFVITAAAFLRP